MKHSAAMQIASNVSTQSPKTLAGDAANENDAKTAVTFTLSDAAKKKLAGQAKALPASALAKLPPYLAERLLWMAGIQATAWRDRDVLTAIDDGEKPVSVHDLEEFGRRVEFAREVEANRTVSITREHDDVSTMSDKDIGREVRRHRSTLCNALDLRAARDAGLRETLTNIRCASRQVDLSRATRQLLNMFNTPEMMAWVTKLPRGEGAALTRLRALYDEWERRHAQGHTPTITVANDDLMLRAWTLAAEPLDRVLTLGRYLTRGVEGRAGDYGYFHPPKSAKRKTVDASKKPPVEPVSKPTG